MPVDFTCAECGRLICAIVLEATPEIPLCAHCVALPGWHEDPELRRIFGVEHPPEPTL